MDAAGAQKGKKAVGGTPHVKYNAKGVIFDLGWSWGLSVWDACPVACIVYFQKEDEESDDATKRCCHPWVF